VCGEDCPVCYNVVQQQVNILRRSVSELRLIIENIGDNPQAINDTDFRRQLTVVNVTVVRLWDDAKRLSGIHDSSSSRAPTPWGTGGTCPHFYKWLGTGGTVSRRTVNKKLTKLYRPSQKRSPKRLIVLLDPKSGGTTTFFIGASRRIGAPHFCSGLEPPSPSPHPFARANNLISTILRHPQILF